MLKIPKGLKKKKKGKKSKRKGEEELFTEEELEKYRREHQSQTQAQTQQVEAAAAQYDSDQESEKPKPDNDEWSKFNALTTGIDTVLKKTQGDLDRIKSTSFFQRIPSGPKLVDRTGKNLPLKRDATKEGQRWVGFEDRKSNGAQQEVPSEQVVKPEEALPATSEFVLSESESEEEDGFDDIFDTSYVDAVQKGEVKLAYVPDSPEEEFDEGPDPFDTSYAEKVIKGPEVSKKGKKLVNIGVAVEILTGRLDNVNQSAAAVKKAKRRIPKDLLFENADPDEVEVEVEEPQNFFGSLLDDGPGILEDVPVDLSVSLHTQFIKKPSAEPSNKSDDKQEDILSTFDTLKLDDEDDEFAQIASESLSKPTATDNPILAPLPTESVFEDSSWAAFEESKSSKPSRPPPPRPSTGPNVNKVESDISPALEQTSPVEFDEGPDPFDTTFAENIAPGKAELKRLEEEFLSSDKTQIPNSDSDFDFNPREGERPFIDNRRQSSVHIHITDPTGIRESISDFANGDIGDFDNLKPVHRDLLGGSSTDLSQLADSPIAPTQDTSEQLDNSDPFDTSIANNIIVPGKTELKFIEDELLGDNSLKKSLSDPDFDPRAEENAEAYQSAPRKPSRPENLLVNKTVVFQISPEGSDLLDIDKSNKKKPVTPYYAREASITDDNVDTTEDTFDTTSDAAGSAKPILKNTQSAAVQLIRSTSDQDLNAEEEAAFEKSFSQLRRHSDFPINFHKKIDVESFEKKGKRTDFLSITEEECVDTKVLTPLQERKDSFDIIESDPFDTSIISDVLRPGKTELKVLESELLAKEADDDFDPRKNEKSKQVQDLLEPSDDVLQVKALTPEIPDVATGFLLNTEEDIDPFDTSFADNLGPGKTELKILESELMN